jgi:hypothetical protein
VMDFGVDLATDRIEIISYLAVRPVLPDFS